VDPIWSHLNTVHAFTFHFINSLWTYDYVLLTLHMFLNNHMLIHDQHVTVFVSVAENQSYATVIMAAYTVSLSKANAAI